MLATLLLLLPSALSPFTQAEADASLHTYHPRTWYADLLDGGALVSPDGRFLIYRMEQQPFLVELESGTVGTLAERIGWDSVTFARWSGQGSRLVVVGREEGEGHDAEIDLQSGERSDSRLWDEIHDMLCAPSPERRIVAARRKGKSALWLQDDSLEEPRALVDGTAKLAWAISPDSARLAFLRSNDAGWADLYRVDLDTGVVRTLLEDLDTSYQSTSMAWWEEEVFLSLVGPERGAPEDKQTPKEGRDLDIYAVSVEDGTLRPVVAGEGDDLVGGVANGHLFWTHVRTSMRIGLVPASGGDVREVVGETASFPFWHPEGDRVSAMYGPMSLADWALNWDLGVMPLDANLRPAGALEPVIVGPHEDFGLTWSPDGRWLAYHSHRSPGPAMAYGGGGATDDIWLRPAAGGEEIRLSNDAGFEVCQPDWSPDGFELMFVAIDPRAGRYRPVVVEIDPETGARVAQRDFRVPGIEGDVLAAAYSPTAPEVALQERTRDGRHHLWIVAIDSLEKRLLAEFDSLPELSGVDFDPWGESVVYTALSKGHHQLFRVDATGDSDPEQLTNVQEELFVPQVSPDGEHIAVTVYTHTKTVQSRPLP